MDIDIADPRVEQYAVEHTSGEPAYFAALAERTRAETDAPGVGSSRKVSSKVTPPRERAYMPRRVNSERGLQTRAALGLS